MTATMAPAAPRRISLVLGSGGARGYAHIGVIEELRAQGYTIEAIAGSSMGALVGGVYAAGKLEAYRDFVSPLQRLDVLRLVDWSWRGGGLIKGDRIGLELRKLVGDVRIEDLPVRYTAVAVDLDAHREVWFSRGCLFDAIRASIAIPTVFRPHRYEGRLLVDGGLLNPLPVSPTLRDLTEATIAVDVNAPAESLDDALPPAAASGAASAAATTAASNGDAGHEAGHGPRKRRFAALLDAFAERHEKRAAEHDPGVIELFARSLDVMQATMTRLKLAAQPPDLLITIPRNASAFYEFYRASELIELGRLRTREALARWQPPSVRWRG
ncbi:MAG: patatin-like phospholipase family protein [Dokdonella sp.]|uniref:patatin-like phospholipase family protein n=1 Tax=Dokdonella sp. TaxID=2291710 RepID=UPI0025C5A91C|nr:patatin-like phospholipase family protein [Dokdonella sp.]MBX3700414.1 patatin-like phospholipase family protein [Dokdonella sp.]